MRFCLLILVILTHKKYFQLTILSHQKQHLPNNHKFCQDPEVNKIATEKKLEEKVEELNKE